MFDVSNDYDESFVIKTFSPVNNGIWKRCNCTAPEKLRNNPRYYESLGRIAVTESKCLSPQKPPLMGTREDTCNGKYPKLPESDDEKLEKLRRDIRSKWTIYLVVGIFLSLVVTAVITFLLTRFMCSGRGDGIKSPRTVSPGP